MHEFKSIRSGPDFLRSWNRPDRKPNFFDLKDQGPDRSGLIYGPELCAALQIMRYMYFFDIQSSILIINFSPSNFEFPIVFFYKNISVT